MKYMGYRWGVSSQRKMATIHGDLIIVLDTALSVCPFDITVVCGARSETEQTRAFEEGRSKKKWPDSLHNCPESEMRSRAVDLAPWINNTIDWTDEGSFYCLAGVMLASANLIGISLTYGGDWNNNGLTKDQTFFDLGHYQLQ